MFIILKYLFPLAFFKKYFNLSLYFVFLSGPVLHSICSFHATVIRWMQLPKVLCVFCTSKCHFLFCALQRFLQECVLQKWKLRKGKVIHNWFIICWISNVLFFWKLFTHVSIQSRISREKRRGCNVPYHLKWMALFTGGSHMSFLEHYFLLVLTCLFGNSIYYSFTWDRRNTNDHELVILRNHEKDINKSVRELSCRYPTSFGNFQAVLFSQRHYMILQWNTFTDVVNMTK